MPCQRSGYVFRELLFSVFPLLESAQVDLCRSSLGSEHGLLLGDVSLCVFTG